MNINEYKSLKLSIYQDMESWLRMGSYDDKEWSEDEYEFIPWDDIVREYSDNELFDEYLIKVAPLVRSYHMSKLNDEQLQAVIDYTPDDEIYCIPDPFEAENEQAGQQSLINKATYYIIVIIMLNCYDNVPF